MRGAGSSLRVWLIGRHSLMQVDFTVAAVVSARVRGDIQATSTRISKQHRKIIAEHFGDKPAFNANRVAASGVDPPTGMEMIFPWAGCTGVKNNPEDIELTFGPGICVLRDRYFAPSPNAPPS